jgi:heme-degrading monooxygenase HmoA
MSKTAHSFGESSVYRVDKFIVPEDALAEFLLRVRDTQTILRQQPGFIRAVILQQSDGPGKFNIVTFVEWRSESELADVRTAVAAFTVKEASNRRICFCSSGSRRTSAFIGGSANEAQWSPGRLR